MGESCTKINLRWIKSRNSVQRERERKRKLNKLSGGPGMSLSLKFSVNVWLATKQQRHAFGILLPLKCHAVRDMFDFREFIQKFCQEREGEGESCWNSVMQLCASYAEMAERINSKFCHAAVCSRLNVCVRSFQHTSAYVSNELTYADLVFQSVLVWQ